MDLRSPFVVLPESFYREALELLPESKRFSVRSALFAVQQRIQPSGSLVSFLGVPSEFITDFAARLMERAKYFSSEGITELQKLNSDFIRTYVRLRDGISVHRGGRPRAEAFFELFEKFVSSRESVEVSSRLETKLVELMVLRDSVALPHRPKLEDIKAYQRAFDELLSDDEFATVFEHTEEKLVTLRKRNEELTEELEIDFATVYLLVEGRYGVPNLYRELAQNFMLKCPRLVADRSKYADVRSAVIAFSVLIPNLGDRYTVQTVASAVRTLGRELVTVGEANRGEVDELIHQYLSDVQWLNDFETPLRAGLVDHFNFVCEVLGTDTKAKQLQLDKLDLLRLKVKDSDSLQRYVTGYKELVAHKSFTEARQTATWARNGKKLLEAFDRLEVIAMAEELEAEAA